MKILNINYRELGPDDLFVCVLGHEPRSYHLLDKNIDTRNDKNTKVFYFPCYEEIKKKKKDYSKRFSLLECNYNEIDKFIKSTKDFFLKRKSGNLYVDYSSMPRGWYCKLPIILEEYTSNDKKLFFLYTAGDYPRRYENSPSAGIDTISVFSGLTLPAVDIKRYHILGLSYDNVRTETIKSILEPNLLISCYAYNPDNYTIKNNVIKLNERTIENSLLSVELPLGNINGMVNKLCELVYDHLRKGQVILVPDGPKPLIMAMSLVPDIVDKKGVTCLHISRNDSCNSKILVKPREDEIYGFQVQRNVT